MSKLFCFSIAGGSSELFHCIPPFLSPALSLLPLEYAGHGARVREPLYPDPDAMAEDLYGLLRQNLMPGERYSLFGYSMGSMALSATLQRIIDQQELPLPKHVFLAAHSPGVSNRKLAKDDISNFERMKAYILHFGGVPSDLAENPLFWKLYLPIYQADYRLMSDFDFDRLALRTEIPTTIFYCEEDTPLHELQRWSRYYVGPMHFHSFEGGHFFLKTEAERIASILQQNAL